MQLTTIAGAAASLVIQGRQTQHADTNFTAAGIRMENSILIPAISVRPDLVTSQREEVPK
jgi:hypothetical protein